MNNKIKNRNSGFSMAMVLSVIVLMLILGSSLLALSENARITSIRRSQEIAAKCAADAGLTKVLSDLNTSYLQGTLELTDLPSETDVPIENFDAKFGYLVYLDGQGNIIIDSTGKSGPSSKTVHCKVGVHSGIFEHALFANNFDISNNAAIDGYNSDYGPYGGVNVISTSIGTNSTSNNSIQLDVIGNLNGDIIVGPGADPVDVIKEGTHFEITGSSSAAEEEKPLPIIAPPATLNYKGTSVNGNINESGIYDTVNSTNGEVITIDGDITLYITGDFRLDNGSTILINPSSSLKLFIAGSFQMSNVSAINNLTEKPPKCMIYSTASSTVNYSFNNTGNFYGALYAPNANVQVSNNAVIYGSIVANELNIDNSAEIYGDKALLNGNFGDEDTKLVNGKWWE